MKISITIDSEEGEDIRRELAKLLKLDGETPAAIAAGTSVVEWTPEDFTKFWGGLKDEARMLLAEIAKHAPTYPFADLRQAVGIQGLGVAGRMSSIGHQKNKFPHRPDVVSRDWNARLYHMDRKIADWILKLATGRKLV